jgi:hypothetical protein
MGATTPIRGLYKPTVDEIGWADAVNANMDNLDTAEDTTHKNVANGYAGLDAGGALPNGSKATTQTAGDNSTKLATTAYVATAIAGFSSSWSSLTAAGANLTLANGAFNTEFDQTSAVSWTWKNTTTGTNLTTNASPVLTLIANYWNGSVSAADTWTIGASLAAGTNGVSVLTIGHSGSTGGAAIGPTVSVPSLTVTGTNGGLYKTTGGRSGVFANGTGIVAFRAGAVQLGSGITLGWSSTTDPDGTIDSAFSRLAASSIALGNGTAGDFTGSLKLGALSQVNGVAATASVAQSSPVHALAGQYWNGSVSANDEWDVQNVIANGTNGASTLTFSHSGSTGVAWVQIPRLVMPAGSTSIPINNGTTLVGGIGTSPSVGIYLGTQGTNFTTFIGGMNVVAFVNNNAVGIALAHVNIGGSTTTASYTGTAVGGTQTHVSAFCTFAPISGSLNFVGFNISPTINQTGTASGGYTALKVNVIETALLGTANKLLDLQAGATGGTSKFAIDNAGKIVQANGEATAGVGSSYLRGATSQKAETGADANVLTVAPAAAVGAYRITVVISVSAATSATLGWTATWTDSNGNAQTPTNLSLHQSGVAAPALTFTTSAAGNYYGEAIIDVNNAGTSIVVKTTFAGTSVAYKITATIERIA